MPLAALSADVDVLTQTDDVVWVRQLFDDDAERAVLRPHSEELSDDQHQRQIQANNSTTSTAPATINLVSDQVSNSALTNVVSYKG